MRKGLIAGCMLALLSAAPATFAASCPGDAQFPGEYSELQKHKSAYLGVEVSDVDSDNVKRLNLKEETGVEVTAVDQDAPAGKAGFKEHDVILTVNGTKIESEEQLRRTIRETPAGRTVDVVISRNGQQMTLKPTLAGREGMANVFVAPRIAVAPDVRVEIPPMPPMADNFGAEGFDAPKVFVYTSTARIGALVENLTPQLGDFFGVKGGSGILVRSVEKGSAAEAGGLKAGDVIVRVGDERISDSSDWRRALRNKSGNLNVGIVREKREQNVTISVPARRQSGEIFNNGDFDWEYSFDEKALQKDLEKLPKIADEQKIAMLKAQKDWQKEFQAHQAEWQKSIAEAQKQAWNSKEQRKAMEDMKKELEKVQKDLQKQFHYISFDMD